MNKGDTIIVCIGLNNWERFSAVSSSSSSSSGMHQFGEWVCRCDREGHCWPKSIVLVESDIGITTTDPIQSMSVPFIFN